IEESLFVNSISSSAHHHGVLKSIKGRFNYSTTFYPISSNTSYFGENSIPNFHILLSPKNYLRSIWQVSGIDPTFMKNSSVLLTHMFADTSKKIDCTDRFFQVVYIWIFSPFR